MQKLARRYYAIEEEKKMNSRENIQTPAQSDNQNNKYDRNIRLHNSRKRRRTI